MNPFVLTSLLQLAAGGAKLGAGIAGMRSGEAYADALEEAGELRARDLAEARAIRRGKIIAAFAASGVDVGTGSPLQHLADNAMAAVRDMQRIQYQYEIRATRAREEGRAALLGGITGMFQTLVSAASVLADIPSAPGAPEPTPRTPAVPTLMTGREHTPPGELGGLDFWEMMGGEVTPAGLEF